MPKKSSAAKLISVDVSHSRLIPPDTLDPEAAAVFRQMVASVDGKHFTRGDLPLIVEFARAAAMADRAARQMASDGAVIDGRPSAWLTVQEKAQRALVAISARLRLCPQSRFDRNQAGSNSRKSGSLGIDALGSLK